MQSGQIGMPAMQPGQTMEVVQPGQMGMRTVLYPPPATINLTFVKKISKLFFLIPYYM